MKAGEIIRFKAFPEETGVIIDVGGSAPLNWITFIKSDTGTIIDRRLASHFEVYRKIENGNWRWISIATAPWERQNESR
jgi:hypothetical protein